MQGSFQDRNTYNSAPSKMKGLTLAFSRKAFGFCPFYTGMVNRTNCDTTGHSESTHFQLLFMKNVLWIMKMPNKLFQGSFNFKEVDKITAIRGRTEKRQLYFPKGSRGTPR